MAFSNGPKIITDGLVLNLSAFDRNSYVSGSTTWNDVSGQGNNGTLTNGPTFNSANGGSITFDGSNDYVGFSSLTSYSGTVPHTYSAWIYVNNFDLYNWVLNNGSSSTGTSLIVYDGKIGFFYSGGDSVVQSATLMNLNTWYNICVTYLGNTIVLMYLNGSLDATKDTTLPTAGLSKSNWSSGNSNPRLGSWYNSNYPFSGRISSVQIYNRALLANEVLQNYNATKSRFGL